jgi:hypothetical protein
MGMKRRNVLCGIFLLSVVILLSGCAGAARDTSGFALSHTATVSAPLAETWQATKAVLREKGLDIYTRDKRGTFVAYSRMKRHRFVPERTHFTIALEEAAPDSTRIRIDTVKQVYSVTLLTYPGWHDRKTTDEKQALAIQEAIEAEVSGSAPETGTAVAVPQA